MGGVLTSGTNSFIVNVAATDKVIIRGLDFEGLGTSVSAIKVINGGTVVVEDCRINNFSGANSNAIDFVPTVAGAKLIVHNCTITNNTLATRP